MKQKYNWYKIKLDYFSSPIKEIKTFFENSYSTYSGHIKSKTKGWTIEKKKLIRRVKREAQIELEQELKELYKPSIEQLSKMHEASISIIQAKVFQIAQNIKKDNFGNIILPDNFNIREVKILYDIIKTEIKECENRVDSIRTDKLINKIIVM